MPRAIVLSGGGALGAYQIGVWKALRKMHIKYDIITGTSVGAINGAMMVQKDYFRALWMWYNLDFSVVYNETLKNDYFTPDGKKELLKIYAKNIILNNGMDIKPLEDNLGKSLNIKKFYKSNVDYGIVLVKLPNFQEITLTKKEIPKNQLKDYIIASATCFPVFKKKEIGNDTYIDGGYQDNLPINLAIEMGATEVIAVDLHAFGIKKKVDAKDVKIKTISPRNDLGSFLVFHRDVARRNIRFGYNDTMKVFKKLDGDKYTFKKGHLEKNISRYQEPLIDILKAIFDGKNTTLADKIFNTTDYYKIIDKDSRITKKTINRTIEYIGKSFKLDESIIYHIKIYNRLITKKIKMINDINAKLIEQKIKNNDIISLLSTDLLIKYIYNKLLSLNSNKKIKNELRNLSVLFPKEFMSAIYIFVINQK